jgi:hypothetical protein
LTSPDINKQQDWVASKIYRPFNEGHGAGYKLNPVQTRETQLIAMYERILIEMCSNRFNWVGMPDTVDLRFLEMTLLRDALTVFYFDEEFQRFMTLRATGLGEVNMYDNPVGYTVYGNQVFSRQLSGNECVPIWANQTRIPDWDIISMYSQRLAALDRTLEINMLSARHPFVFAVNNNEYNSMVQAFNKVVEGQPVIFGTEALSAESMAEKISLFDIGYKPNQIKDVMDAKVRTWNETLTLLGIMNVNSEKRERMVVEEASGASGQVLAMRAVALNERQRACERINKMYGLDVMCQWNLDEVTTAKNAALGGVVGGLADQNPGLGSTDLEEMHKNG